MCRICGCIVTYTVSSSVASFRLGHINGAAQWTFLLQLVASDCKMLMEWFVCVAPATMGAIFGMATCLSAQAREAPDDPLNYFIGGCASGIFLGARSKYQFWRGFFLSSEFLLLLTCFSILKWITVHLYKVLRWILAYPGCKVMCLMG